MSVADERMCTKYWLTALVKACPEKSVVSLTDRLNMTIVEEWDVKPPKNHHHPLHHRRRRHRCRHLRCRRHRDHNHYYRRRRNPPPPHHHHRHHHHHHFNLFSFAGDLQCPSCTYITISPEVNIPSLFRGAIDSVLGLFQDDECSKVLKGPVPEVNMIKMRKK